VVNENALADARRRMYFYSCEGPGNLRKPSGRQVKPLLPQPVRRAMKNQSVQARVAKKYLKRASSGRIALESRLYIAAYLPEQCLPPERTRPKSSRHASCGEYIRLAAAVSTWRRCRGVQLNAPTGLNPS
jgi:hypothetical protein